jgi:hypothetical protein
MGSARIANAVGKKKKDASGNAQGTLLPVLGTLPVRTAAAAISKTATAG